MNGPHRSGPRPEEAADDPGTWRPSRGYLAIAIGIAAGGLVYALVSLPTPRPLAADAAAPPPAAPRASGPVAAAPAAAVISSSNSAPPVATATSGAPRVPAEAPQVSRARDPNGDLTPDIADYVNQGEKPTMAEVIDRLHRAGVYGGLGAFSPPGTRPPLIGLAVPEDFVLPEGYVRHYQSTDDGQGIEPILMFSPDAQLVDAAQRPIAIPPDRVVPPELAPPGLPIRRIVLPAPTETGRTGR